MLGMLEVGLAAGRRADADVVVGEADVERLAVGLAVDGHRLDPQLPAGPDDPQGDLPAVGDQDFLEQAAGLLGHQGVRSSDCATPASPVISENFRSDAESTPDTRRANSFGLVE